MGDAYMGNKFSKTINKLALNDIQDLFNKETLEIIHAFNRNFGKKKLTDTLLDIYDPVDILDDPIKRKVVLEALSEKDAVELAKSVELYTERKNVWDTLKAAFRSSKQKKQLYQFFDINDVNLIEEEPSLISPAQEVITPLYPLFKHQETAVSEVKECFLKHDRVLLHMPTGSGKTRTAVNFICDFLRNSNETRDNMLIVWLADTEELCEQASKELINSWNYLGVGDITINRLYSRYELDLSDIQSGILIAGASKLYKRLIFNQKKAIPFAKKCSLLIFDEAHKILAPTYKYVSEQLSLFGRTAKVLGLSATPGRVTQENDEFENQRLADFFQSQKVVLKVDGYNDPITYLQDEGYLAQVNYHDVNYESSELQLSLEDKKAIEEKDEIPNKVLAKISIDAKRNLKIVNIVSGLVKEDKKMILFACSVSHAEALCSLFNYKNINARLISAKTRNAIRKQTIEDYKNGKIDVLVNFGVLTTGFDAPITNVAIITRPTKSLTLYSQMVGRATRGVRAGGNKQCDIYTVIDASIPAFRSVVESFQYWDDCWKQQ